MVNIEAQNAELQIANNTQGQMFPISVYFDKSLIWVHTCIGTFYFSLMESQHKAYLLMKQKIIAGLAFGYTFMNIDTNLPFEELF